MAGGSLDEGGMKPKVEAAAAFAAPTGAGRIIARLATVPPHFAARPERRS